MPATRRRLLATAGIALLGGCSGIDLFGSDRGDPPAPALTEPADWEHPEYDAGNTRAPPGDAAPDDLESDGWTVEFTDIDPTDVAGPVVADGIAYIVLAGRWGSVEAERLVAFDAGTGDERWRVEGEGSLYAHPPAVSGESVLWLSSGGTVRSLHPVDGATRWRRSVATHSRVLPAHGLVLTGRGAGGNASLAALDPRTGNTYWSRSSGGRRWTPLAADEDAFYAMLGGDGAEQPPALHALDPATGETRWSTRRVSPRTATVRSGVVYCSTGPPAAQELLAFDGRDQAVSWAETNDLQFPDDDGFVNVEQDVAALTEETLLLHYDFHGAANDRIEARDPDTGDVRWSVIGADDEQAAYAPPVVAGDRVYLVEWRDDDAGDPDSTLRVLDRDGGNERTRVDLPEPTVAAPVVADGHLFLRTEPSNDTAGVRVL
jgi:outer membrane protein assembly factor BamB